MVVCKIMLIRFIIWPLFITSFCVFNVLGTFFLRREREEFWKHEAVRWKPLFQSFSSRLRFSGSDCRKRIRIGLGDKARDKRLMKANWFWDAWFYWVCHYWWVIGTVWLAVKPPAENVKFRIWQLMNILNCCNLSKVYKEKKNNFPTSCRRWFGSVRLAEQPVKCGR